MKEGGKDKEISSPFSKYIESTPSPRPFSSSYPYSLYLPAIIRSSCFATKWRHIVRIIL